MKHGDSLTELMVKRERLLGRCAAQREDLAALARDFEGPLKIADGAVAAVRYVRRHPVVAGAAVALLAIVERRRLWTWARRGFVVWRTYRVLGKSGLKSLL